MSLDHDSGTLHGRVTQGQYQGCTLDNLALADLINLLAECSLSDQQSVTILETYLDRRCGIEWRKHSEASENTEDGWFVQTMTWLGTPPRKARIKPDPIVLVVYRKSGN